MRIVAISDTHRLHNDIKVPDGDVLIHAGDFTGTGKIHEIAAFDVWLAKQPHRHKIVIAGNHDVTFETMPHIARASLQHATYLEDSGVEIDGFKIWGSPWQPRFCNWAFNVERGEKLRQKWEQIPERVDILITHGPPYGILDSVASGEHVGCEELLKAVDRVHPRLHVFGHIHESSGSRWAGDILFVNASICDGRYRPVNRPFVFDLEPLP